MAAAWELPYFIQQKQWDMGFFTNFHHGPCLAYKLFKYCLLQRLLIMRKALARNQKKR